MMAQETHWRTITCPGCGLEIKVQRITIIRGSKYTAPILQILKEKGPLTKYAIANILTQGKKNTLGVPRLVPQVCRVIQKLEEGGLVKVRKEEKRGRHLCSLIERDGAD